MSDIRARKGAPMNPRKQPVFTIGGIPVTLDQHLEPHKVQAVDTTTGNILATLLTEYPALAEVTPSTCRRSCCWTPYGHAASVLSCDCHRKLLT